MHLRFFFLCFFLIASMGCAPHPALSAFSAGRASARLANDRCYREYGKRPFVADDFDAVFDQGRWHWGGPESNAVDGFRAEVILGPHGETKEVAVTGAEEK